MHRSQLQSATASHLADADLVTCMQLASFKGELHACHQSLTNTRQLMLRARVAEDRALGGEKDRLKTDLESLQVEHEGLGVERDGLVVDLVSKSTERAALLCCDTCWTHLQQHSKRVRSPGLVFTTLALQAHSLLMSDISRWR